MDLYGQDVEVSLLRRFLPYLPLQTIVDVGAELGAFTAHLLTEGASGVWAIEPHPDNARALRARFSGDARVRVVEVAASDVDGFGRLRVAARHDGEPMSYGHTLHEFRESVSIRWNSDLPVRRSTLSRLVDEGVIPRSVGIVKIDTEGHDLAVACGMGKLEAAVVMVEHWIQLPEWGPCAWTLDEMTELLSARGFDDYFAVIHSGEFTSVTWNACPLATGDAANLIFIRGDLVSRLLPAVFDVSATVAQTSIAAAKMYANAATDRLEVIRQLERRHLPPRHALRGLRRLAVQKLQRNRCY